MGISPLTRIRIANAIRGFLPDKDDALPPSFACILQNFDSIQQDGPQCGLVALKMAAKAVKSENDMSIDEIYDRASEQSFTNNGELYSALWMTKLATQLSCDAEHRTSFPSPKEMWETLISGKACLLVPYDTDKNHEPCNNNGHTAHWALITGCLMILTKPMGEMDPPGSPDEDIHNLFWVSASEKLPDSFDFDSSVCLVFAYHGKSKHPGLWSYDKLKASNANLESIGPKREADEYQYILPEEGVKGGLCGQVVTVRKCQSPA